MPLITPDVSGIVDGGTASAANVTNPLNTITNLVNGQLDTANFAATSTNLATIAQSVAWTTWVPTLTAGGSMTYTATATIAYYMQIGKLVWIQLNATGTTGGSAANTLRFTLPVTAADANQGLPCHIDDGGVKSGFGELISTTVVQVVKYDASNFGLGSARVLRAYGCYQSA